jgi:hypothetical protein
MTDPGEQARPLTFEQLSDLRRKTEIISKFLQEQLQIHLETLRAILSPERVFGKYVGGRGDSALADRAFAQLQQGYRPFTSRPFDLPTQLDEHWLSLVGSRVALYPWEYTYEARSDREARTVTMSAPIRWVMSYTSAYSLSQVKQALAGKGERRPEHVRQFVVNALVMQLMITHAPGLAALLGDLRYQLQTDTSPDLEKLPLTVVTSGVPSFRPSDDLILAATNFSGVPAFIELVDLEAFERVKDPLRARIEDLLRAG